MCSFCCALSDALKEVYWRPRPVICIRKVASQCYCTVLVLKRLWLMLCFQFISGPRSDTWIHPCRYLIWSHWKNHRPLPIFHCVLTAWVSMEIVVHYSKITEDRGTRGEGPLTQGHAGTWWNSRKAVEEKCVQIDPRKHWRAAVHLQLHFTKKKWLFLGMTFLIRREGQLDKE